MAEEMSPAKRSLLKALNAWRDDPKTGDDLFIALRGWLLEELEAMDVAHIYDVRS